MTALMMAVFGWACFRDGEGFVALFDATPKVVAAALGYIRWVVPSYVALGIGIVLGSAVQGAGSVPFRCWTGAAFR